jgi:nucleotide-binding universal stress UspA family protein
VTLLVVLIIAWVVIGLVAGIVMGRRGHNAFGWAVIGCVLGPLVVPVALSSIRGDRETRSVTLAPGAPGSGRIDVLVGIDGSVESHAAVGAVVALLGDRIRNLTLAAVLDQEALRPNWTTDDQASAESTLAEAARTVAATDLGIVPQTVLLAGAPARALLERATSTGADLIAIGTRGRGASTAVLGSVATKLAANTEVPVLVVSGPTAPPGP